MKKRKIGMLLALALAMVFTTLFLIGCGATTSHSGRTVTGTRTAVESAFMFLTPAEFTALTNTWDELETESERAATPFISGLSGMVSTPTEGSVAFAATRQRATYRRQMLTVNMFGETNWPNNRERVVTQGYFGSQNLWNANLRDGSIGTPASVASALNLGTEPGGMGWTAGSIEARISNRWNLIGYFAPTDSPSPEDFTTRLTNVRNTLRVEASDLFLTPEMRALGYFITNPTAVWLSSNDGQISIDSNTTSANRYIRQTITDITTHFGEANIRNPQRVETTNAMQWNADMTSLVSGTVTTIYGEADHDLRPVVMVRTASSLYDRGDMGDHWIIVEYVGNQVQWVELPHIGIEIEFIINRP